MLRSGQGIWLTSSTTSLGSGTHRYMYRYRICHMSGLSCHMELIFGLT
jgi:hypothetical protein